MNLRIVFTSDWHLSCDPRQSPTMERLVESVRQINPNLIVGGGDFIRDGGTDPQEVSRLQWQEVASWQEQLGLIAPLYALLGNHDFQFDISLGNRLIHALHELRIEQGFYKKEVGSWTFIFLNSTCLTTHSYRASLDQKQLEFLQTAINEAKGPVGVFSHIPILSAAVFHDGELNKGDHWQVPGKWMHLDSLQIHQILANSKKVRFACAGHLHLFERVMYDGLQYIAAGALSGNWWEGSYRGTPPGFVELVLSAEDLLNVHYHSLL